MFIMKKHHPRGSRFFPRYIAMSFIKLTLPTFARLSFEYLAAKEHSFNVTLAAPCQDQKKQFEMVPMLKRMISSYWRKTTYPCDAIYCSVDSSCTLLTLSSQEQRGIYKLIEPIAKYLFLLNTICTFADWNMSPLFVTLTLIMMV